MSVKTFLLEKVFTEKNLKWLVVLLALSVVAYLSVGKRMFKAAISIEAQLDSLAVDTTKTDTTLVDTVSLVKDISISLDTVK